MKKEYDDELTTEQREKMRKNLVYVGIFSVVMIFAGLTSGYIVSMGDSFWVKYNFPPAFWISTVLLAVSSIVLTVGIKLAQKGNHTAAKIGVTATFILGVAFAFFQCKGYMQLFERGTHPVQKIIVTQGRYGEYYQLKVNGKYMDVDGNDYLIAGKKATAKEKADIAEFAKQFGSIDKKLPSTVKGYDKYTLVYKNEEVSYKNGKFYVADTAELMFTDLNRLKEFSWPLRDGRGDFFISGSVGKDFHLFFTGRLAEHNYLSIRTGAIFWHFLGLLWGYLLLFLLFIH